MKVVHDALSVNQGFPKLYKVDNVANKGFTQGRAK